MNMLLPKPPHPTTYTPSPFKLFALLPLILLFALLHPSPSLAKKSGNKGGFGAQMDISFYSQLSTNIDQRGLAQGVLKPAGTFEYRHWSNKSFVWGFHLGFNHISNKANNTTFLSWGFSLLGSFLQLQQSRFLLGLRTSLLYAMSLQNANGFALPTPFQLELNPLLGFELFLVPSRKASVAVSLGLPINITIGSTSGFAASIESINVSFGAYYYFD